MRHANGRLNVGYAPGALAFFRAGPYNKGAFSKFPATRPGRRDLQGREYIPTGGIVRKPRGKIRCNSGTDGTVRMREDMSRGLSLQSKPISQGEI